jgi:glycosyltransferase involved in cell wall biosynthesis
MEGAGKRIIVSVINDLVTDQRVHKVCTFLHNEGFGVLLIGRKLAGSQELAPRAYRTRRMRLIFEKGPLFYAFFNVRLFVRLLFTPADVLLSNDLDTLWPNYIISKLKRIPLVYDTHEYFTEVPELLSRPKVRNIWLAIEKRIFPKLRHVYTVNDSIARLYSGRYGNKISVVRNVSPLWKPENIPSKAELGIPENCRLMIMQGAGLNIDRGVEQAVEAMKFIEGARLLIVGDGDIIPQVKEMVKMEKLEDKVLFFGKRPYAELMHFTWHADLGLSFDQPTNPNYLYSLPNKVFDYMHAQTPVACSEVVEVAALVRKHDIGIAIGDFRPEQLAERLSQLLFDSAELSRLQENCRIAARTENWENETAVLRKIYERI